MSIEIKERTLSASRLFNAPVKMVWEAWTKPDLIKVWWGPDGFTSTITRMEVFTGGKWELTMHGPDGTDYKNNYTFLEIIPYRKIVMEHLTGPKFTTTILFNDEGENTRIEYHMFFEAEAGLQKALEVFKADEGLKQNLDRLNTYLKKSKMGKTTFTKDLAKKQLFIVREFEAPVEMVWKAWTESSLLDQWWAPKPWKAETKSMNFREGGHWLYCMTGPEGEKHWSKADFEKIELNKSYSGYDAFCDEEGKINEDVPGMHWLVNFMKSATGTRVEVTVTFASVENLETIISMGFQEGFESAHTNLDELLKGSIHK